MRRRACLQRIARNNSVTRSRLPTRSVAGIPPTLGSVGKSERHGILHTLRLVTRHNKLRAGHWPVAGFSRIAIEFPGRYTCGRWAKREEETYVW